MFIRHVDEESEDYQKLMLDRLTLTFDYVFNRVVQRHLRKFDRLIEYVGPLPGLPSKVEKIFNLFMFINKLLIWFVLCRKTPTSKLRHICGRKGTMKRFCVMYLDRLRKVLGYDQTNVLINNLNILLHMMVLSKIIRDIQERDSEYVRLSIRKTSSGELAGPLVVFEEIYNKCMKNLCETSDYQSEITKKASKLIDALKEYEEFEGVTLNAEDIVRNALKILK
jgi:hypothetical protein